MSFSVSERVFNIHAAKTQLSELIARVEAGEEIVIARANRPVAKIVALDPPMQSRTLGQNRGGVTAVADDFDAPLPADYLIAAASGPLRKAAQSGSPYAAGKARAAGAAGKATRKKRQ